MRRELSRRHPDSLFLWTLANREFAGRPILLPPMLRALYQDEHPFLVIMKSAQVGASEYLINCALWAADTGQGRGNALYIMPAQAQAIDFASARINKALLEAPELLERVRPRPAAVSSAARTATRRIGPGHLYVRGAESPRQLIIVDADLVILDELDIMAEGTLDIARRRLASSKFSWIRLASTPSLPNTGIHAWFLRGDQRRWFISCTSCHTEQTLTWRDNVDHERARIVCVSCRQPLDTQSKGRWIAGRPEVADVRSYHLSRLYSPYLDLRQLIEASQVNDPVGVREFFNADLGEPYAGEGDQLDFPTLDACRRSYRAAPSEELSAMGVDVGQKRLHVVIRSRAPDDDGESRLLSARTVDSFDQLDQLMRTYRVYWCVVDLQPETHLAREFAARWRGKVWLCRYHNCATRAAWDASEHLVTVDRTIAFDALFQGFRDGRVTLPVNARELGGEVRDNAGAYYRQLCSLTRTAVEDASGNALFRYSKTGDDHFAHAENYCALALSRLPRPTPSAFNADYGQGYSRLAGLPGAFHGGSRLDGLPGRARPDFL